MSLFIRKIKQNIAAGVLKFLNLSPRLFFTFSLFFAKTVTSSLVSEGGVRGWGENSPPSGASPPLERASPPLGHASPTRLKRITNTDSVYTMCQTPEGAKFQCAICARVFNLKCTLLRHVRHQHQGRFVPHPCKTCGQVFKRTDHLKVHMKKIHNMTIQNSHSPQAHANQNSQLVNSV